MDKRRSIKNISVSIAFRLLLLIGNLFVRRFLIRYIGNEVNGLNALFLSIIGFLSVAELGIGTAITFCMYKPIVEGDNDKVSALYCLFKKIYIVIGAVIAAGGCAILPLLPYFARDYQAIDVNVYFTFGLMLISVVLTYAFSAKTSLINAYKNNYITTTINSSGLLLQYVSQITVLILTSSFVWYLVCRIVSVVFQWAVTEVVIHKKYKFIVINKQKVDKETKGEVVKNVKAMFMHKIGNVLVNTADSIIISTFIGVVILGKYSNYTTIMTAMTGTIVLFFTPLTSVIGHLFVEEDSTVSRKYCNFFYVLNYIIGCIFFLGYYAVIDDLVTLFFGDGLLLRKSVSFVITLNYFVQFMKSTVGLFRDSSGTFYYDRWKPIVEGIINIGLSIGFVYLFKYLWGDDFAVVGVIVATIITNLLICHVVEPHVLYKYAFKKSPKNYYIRNYLCIAIFAGALTALHFSLLNINNTWGELFANGAISLAFSFGIAAAVVALNKDFRHYIHNIMSKLFGRRRRNQQEVAETTAETETVEASEPFAQSSAQEPVAPPDADNDNSKTI